MGLTVMQLGGTRTLGTPLALGAQALAGGTVSARRSAFTLVELLVVLVILVAILAMAWPAMRNSLERHELRDSAQRVKQQLYQARVRAIETGTAYQFRYELGGERFAIAPAGQAVSDEDTFWPPPAQQSTRQLIRHSPELMEPPVDPSLDRLAAGVTFADPQLALPGDHDLPPSPLAAGGSPGWSAPIVFYPSGRSPSALIRLHGGRGLVVDIQLRGAAGLVQIGHPYRPAALPRPGDAADPAAPTPAVPSGHAPSGHAAGVPGEVHP